MGEEVKVGVGVLVSVGGRKGVGLMVGVLVKDGVTTGKMVSVRPKGVGLSVTVGVNVSVRVTGEGVGDCEPRSGAREIAIQPRQ